MEISIVIPTYNRKEILKRCLEALQKQNFDHQNFEVIIVEDSEEMIARETVQNFSKTAPFGVRYFSQKKSGQGMARNFGVKEARGDIIIFIGDDIFPHPDFLKEHFETHQKHPKENETCLGLILWHPEIKVTPLMDFMTQGGALFGKFGGHQFAYDLLEGKEQADYRFFYTSNISLKRSLLQRFHFDPQFAGYGWEDIELGYRLQKEANLKIFYNPRAEGYHYHPIKDEDFINRMRNIGQSLHLFQKKYPELELAPIGKKKLALSILTNPLTMEVIKPWRNLYYYALSKKYFLEGYSQNK